MNNRVAGLIYFLHPAKKPIAGGTYFPPVQKYGRKSFTEILAIIKDVWNTL